jgi:hypothetical protein
MYVNPSTGASPGVNVPAGATVPVAELNTLASILTVCVNSAGGSAGDGTPCGTLLSAATPSGGVAPANAIAAALNIANNPQANVSTLFGLVSAIGPFQPLLTTAPADFVIQLIVAGGGLSISPDSLVFPSAYVSFISAPMSVTITNTSSNPIGFKSIDIVGANNSDFTLPLLSSTCGSYLLAGDTCRVMLIFTPSGAGPRNAALVLGSTSPYSPQFIPVTGTGLAGVDVPLIISPSSLSFTLAGVPQTVTVTNASSSPVTLGNIFSDIASQTNNCPQVLDAQSICTISVQVSSLGYATSGNLTITSSTASSPQKVPINLPGSAVNFNAAPLDFGAWPVGLTSPLQMVTASAGGYSNPAPPFSASLTGSNASDFSLSTACATNLCRANITFTPGGTGARTATLVTNYGNVSLTGTGNSPGPSFTISPFPVNVSSQINISTTAVLTLQNNGTTTINPSSANITGLNASDFSVTDSCTSNLTFWGSCSSLTMGFTPSQLGVRTATLTVTDTISGVSKSITLNGTGTPSSPVVSPPTVNFGNVGIGSQSSATTISVTAFSGDPVSITSYAGNTTPFLLSAQACSQTPCQFSVTYQPTSLGNQDGVFIVRDTITQQYSLLEVNGTGGVPALSLSTSSLIFAARNQGSMSIPQTMTLTNTGDGNLALGLVTLGGTNPADFSIQSNTCASVISPNANCSIGLSFSPTASGQRRASLQIVSNSASSPDNVQLTGTGN